MTKKKWFSCFFGKKMFDYEGIEIWSSFETAEDWLDLKMNRIPLILCYNLKISQRTTQITHVITQTHNTCY